MWYKYSSKDSIDTLTPVSIFRNDQVIQTTPYTNTVIMFFHVFGCFGDY